MDTIARPFGLLLMFLYNITHNYLISIVLFTVIVKLILMPFQMKSKKGMMRQQMLQPQIQEIQKKHAANQQKMNEELQRVYREAGVSPLSGCLWSLLPFPILIALYQAIRKPLTVMMGVPKELLAAGGAIYEKLSELGFPVNTIAQSQITATEFINSHFSEFAGLSDRLRQMNFTVLGLDLSATPNFRIWTYDWSEPSRWWPAVGLFLIPILAAFFMWLSTKISTVLQKGLPGANIEQLEKQSNSMLMIIMGPVMSLWFAFVLPAAMGVYWIVNSIVSLLVDVFLTKFYARTMLADFAEQEAARKAREAELEAKREEAERRRAESGEIQTDNTSARRQRNKKKQEAADRALEWQRANNPGEPRYEPSRVGNRRYARGRSYDPGRYSFNGMDGATGDTSEIDSELSEDMMERLERAALPDVQNDSSPEGDAPEEE